MPRSRAVDRAMKIPGKGPWIATGVVVVLGLIVLVWVVSPSQRARRSVMSDLGLGADSAAVLTILGQPLRCPAAAGAQLRSGLPTDWPPPAVEEIAARLEAATAARWVYPIGRRTPSCAPRGEQTEIGVGQDGRVLWYIPVTGRSELELPDEYSPSEDAS